MDAGVLELVAILMSLQGFGVDANPKAPSPAQITKYEVQDADYMAYVDFEAFVPRNFKAFVNLPNEKAIQRNPRLSKEIAKIVREVKSAQMMAKTMIGFDPVKDLKSAAVWVKVPATGPPTGVAVIRGNFPLNLIESLGRMPGAAGGAKINNNPTLLFGGGNGMVGFAKSDSALIIGTPALVKARLAANWGKKRGKPGKSGLRVRRLLRTKPFFAVASTPSAAAGARLKHQLPRGPDKFLGEVLTGHSFASLALYNNGIGWTWIDRNSLDGYKRAVMASEGLLDLFRSLQLGSRGLVKVALSVVDSYTSVHPVVAQIAKNKKQILALLSQVTGSGNFKVRWTKRPRAKTVTVRARGKRLSDVVPLAGALPLFAGLAYMHAGESDTKSASSGAKRVQAPVAAQATPPGGLRVRDTYRRVKREKLHRSHAP